MQVRIYGSIYLLGLSLRLLKIVHSLSISPKSIVELEHHSEVHFFCRENKGTFAIDIVWQDPHNIFYIPGSLSEGRISAEGSRLSIYNPIRNDTGHYRCLRNNNHTEFAEGSLTVNAPPRIINLIPVHDIQEGTTSVIKSTVDRGSPLADINWLRVTYDNETREEKVLFISDPRFKVVNDGLEISDVQLSDEGIYRCYMYNIIGVAFFDTLAILKELNQPQVINCSVRIISNPDQAITGKYLPNSNTTNISTIFQVNPSEYCKVELICSVTNWPYVGSNQSSTLSLDSSENYCSSNITEFFDSSIEVVPFSVVTLVTVALLKV